MTGYATISYDSVLMALGSVIAYWPCDDAPGSAVLHDLAYDLGLGVIGPIDYAVSTHATLGKPSILPGDTSSTSMYHDGVASLQKVLNSGQQAILLPGGPITYMAWVAPDSFVTPAQWVMGQWGGAILQYVSDRIVWYINTANSQAASVSGGQNLPTMLACTYDLNTMSIYVNGLLVQSFANTTIPTPSIYNFQIGGAILEANELAGYFQKLAIFNKALSGDQIQGLYVNGTGTVDESSNSAFNVTPFSRQINTTLNASRKTVTLVNDSDTPMYMQKSPVPLFGGTAAAPHRGILLPSGGGQWTSSSYKGYFQICHGSWYGAKTLLVQEF